MQFTIFTPTYNRADLLPRLFASIEKQDALLFEWLIVDDGSTDGTAELVAQWSKKVNFPIRYYPQDNVGKVRSINRASALARGRWFITMDSDDWFFPETMSEVNRLVTEIEASDDGENYGALSVLKVYETAEVVGENYARMAEWGENYIDRFNRGIQGDKWEIIRSDLVRDYPYPISDNEKYMAPEYAWLDIGRNWKTRFVSQPLCYIEYQDAGISQNNIAHRVNSPRSAVAFYKLAASVSDNWKSHARALVNWYRFRLHVGDSLSLREKVRWQAWLGSALWMKDIRNAGGHGQKVRI